MEFLVDEGIATIKPNFDLLVTLLYDTLIFCGNIVVTLVPFTRTEPGHRVMINYLLNTYQSTGWVPITPPIPWPNYAELFIQLLAHSNMRCGLMSSLKRLRFE